MAIELKKYKSQVDIKSLDVARPIDASATIKAAGQEAIIPMSIVDALGEQATNYASKLMKAKDDADQADYNSKVLELQRNILQAETDAQGKVPYNEMYNQIVKPQLDQFEKSLPGLGYSQPMTKKVINDFVIDKEQIANSSVLEASKLQQKDFQVQIERDIEDQIASMPAINPESIIIPPNFNNIPKQILEAIEIKRGNIPKQKDSYMASEEELTQYEPIYDDAIKIAEQTTIAERQAQRDRNLDLSRKVQNLSNMVGETTAREWYESKVKARLEQKIKYYKDTEGLTYQDRLQGMQQVINEGMVLSEDSREEVDTAVKIGNLGIAEGVADRIKTKGTEFYEALAEQKYDKFAEIYREYRNEFENPQLRKVIDNVAVQKLSQAATTQVKTNKKINSLQEAVRKDEDLLSAFYIATKLRTGKNIFPGIFGREKKIDKNYTLKDALKDTEKLNPEGQELFLMLFQQNVDALIESKTPIEVVRYVNEESSFGIPFIGSGGKRELIFDETGADFLDELIYYSPFVENKGKFIKDTMNEYIKFKKEVIKTSEGKQSKPTIAQYSDFKKAVFDESIDNILGLPMYLRSPMSEFTGEVPTFSTDQLNMIQRIANQ